MRELNTSEQWAIQGGHDRLAYFFLNPADTSTDGFLKRGRKSGG
jgi:hypothetical protein